MLTVEILDQVIAALGQMGVETRLEWLDGRGGGTCEFAGRKWLFLDLAQTPGEQLEQALSCLAAQPGLEQLPLRAELNQVLIRRKSA
jgi:hypothetical protein